MHTTLPPHISHKSSDTALQRNTLHLSSLVVRDMRAWCRGKASDEFRAATAAYTVTDLASDQFLEIHRAASLYPLKDYSRDGFRSCPLDDFREFLRTEGPILRELYLDFKSRGHTGCYIISDDASRRLNRIHQGCAATSEVAFHSFNSVLVDGRMYWLDFSIDQFVDYQGIIQRTNPPSPQPPPSYYGALVMPSDLTPSSSRSSSEILFSLACGSYSSSE